MPSIAPKAALALRNILIATDFSPCSDRALLHAVAAAHRFSSTLHVVHVIPAAMFAIGPPEGYLGAVESELYAAQLAHRFLTAIAIPSARNFAIRLMSFTGTGLASGKCTVPFRTS